MNLTMQHDLSFNIKRLNLTSKVIRGLSDARLLPYLVLAVLVATVAVGASAYLYYKYQNTQKQLKSQVSTAKESIDETKKIIDEVGKLIDLPKDEEPTIATVTDIDKLKDQPFFQKAKMGDKVLIYAKAKKAILYDPKDEKILEAGFFTTALSEKELTVTLRNGTSNAGLATKTEEEVKKIYPEAKITTEWTTIRGKYDKTSVILLDDSAKDQVIKLAKTFNAQIGELPEGEDKPKDSKILIILGKDRI